MPLVFLLVISILFFVLAGEDVIFKEWRDTYSSLFRWYGDLEYYGLMFLEDNDRVLIDLSVLRNVKSPFTASSVGSLRRSFYMRMAPSIKEGMILFKDSTPGFLLARISRGMKFKYMPLDYFEGSSELRSEDYPKILEFMKRHRIAYFVTDFFPANWTQKKNLLASKGFPLVYNNVHFMLFSLK